MVQAKPVKLKALKKTKPIIPVALLLLDEKKKTKPTKSLSKKIVNNVSHALANKLVDPTNLCIMKTSNSDKGLKKKDNAKILTGNPIKFKPRKEKPDKHKTKVDRQAVSSVNKFSKKVTKLNSSPANVGKTKTKTDNCLPVAKVPKTKKLIHPKKKVSESKSSTKDTTCDVHKTVNKKSEPKKPSQTKKQSKNTSVDVNKKLKPVNKNSTKGNNVSKVVIVKKLEKPSKSNSKNMAVSKLLTLNEAKPKSASPKKKATTKPKKTESDTEQNNNVESGKPKTKRKPKVEAKKAPKKSKKDKEEPLKTAKAKVEKVEKEDKDENKLALVPVIKPQGRGRKNSSADLEPRANNQLVLHTGRKVVERKKRVVVNRRKKQRVASLNALAKVHCLYENDINCIKTTSTSINNSETAIIVSRSHRSAPGLRSIGHHWEMSDSSSTSSSSSDDSSDHEIVEERKEEKLEVVTPIAVVEEEVKPKKRRKRATEIKMDLKDMVVRKRMASLNASAILAASYSSEKRSTVIVKTQDETKKKQAKEKEELVLGKRKSKKNKLSVIVEHQDTDVTITVNRSTRSTHERVCSINGMHYCISSTTSHTQTEATTVATEAVLHAENQPPPLPQLTDTASPCTSYTPLTALSSMTPPGAPTQESHRSSYSGNSAFTPPGHYRHNDYYQPAGPLISQQPLPLPPPNKSHPPEPLYPPPPPMYPQYHPPYESSLHSSYPSYYAPQPVYSQRYYPNPKELAPPPQYYPGYGPPQHSYCQPPPPSLYLYPSAPPSYPPQGNAPPSSCYSHPSGSVNPRLGPIDSGHTSCPCPLQSCSMQPCSKNSHAGPLNGSADKGFPKPVVQQPPLPLLALSLELPNNLGPPSPARGSTGMPPPPSPALVTARNPDNGLLTTSKLISESMQVTNDDKMKLGVAKCESGGENIVSDLVDLKQSRKRKQPSIIDRSGLKKIAQECSSAQSLKEVNAPLKLNSAGELKQSPPSDVTNVRSPQLPPSLSTSQLLLKPALPLETERPVPRYNHIMPQQVHRTSEIILHKKKNGLKKRPLIFEENKESLLPNGLNQLSPVNPPAKQQGPVFLNNQHNKQGVFLNNQPNKQSVFNNQPNKQSVFNNQPNKQSVFNNQPNKQSVFNNQPNKQGVCNNQLKQGICLNNSSNKQAICLNNQPKQGVCFNKQPNKPLLNSPMCFNVTPSSTKLCSSKSKPGSCGNKPVPIVKKQDGTFSRSAPVAYSKQIPPPIRLRKAPPGSNKLAPDYPNSQAPNCSHGDRSGVGGPWLLGASKKIPVLKKDQDWKYKYALNGAIDKKCNLSSEQKKETNLSPTSSKPDCAYGQKPIECTSLPLDMMTKKPVLKKDQDWKYKYSLNGALEKKCSASVEQKIEKTNLSPSSSKSQQQVARKLLKPIPDLSKLSPNSLVNKTLKWSNGWSWEGVPFEAPVFLAGDEQRVVRNCYPAMRHIEGDIIQPRDCILLKSGTRKKDLPFIAKVGSLWENPDDGEMMVSLLWYYRPEHTEQGTSLQDNKQEIYASRHRDINSVACIEDKCYVLTYREYCRYRKKIRSIEDNVSNVKIIVPPLADGEYERESRQPPGQVSPDRVFYCHKVYDFRTKRLLKNPC